LLPRQVLHRALELVHVLKVVRLGCRQRKRVLHEVCGIALAAAAGGTVHGFFLNESSLGYRILWPFTLVVMGITALAGVHIGTALQFNRSVAIQDSRPRA